MKYLNLYTDMETFLRTSIYWDMGIYPVLISGKHITMAQLTAS